MDQRSNRPADDALRSALFTDLYQLTMAQAYLSGGLDATAVFELFYRTLPPGRNYMMAAGLDDVLAFLDGLQFSEEDVEFVREQGQFKDDFLDNLRRLRFTGDVYAVPEGTLVFPGEPLAQVIAPLPQAQLVETLIITQFHFQTLAATKAARVVAAAEGRAVVEFGSRRAHGGEAALKVARNAYLAGAAGTSNVLAGKRFGIPLFGTMAHSYIQAHDDEAAAFEAFTRLYRGTTLLVDTYDTLAGVQKVIDLAQRVGDEFHVGSIRLDSGDLAELAKASRRMLDEAGLDQVKIFASNSLDEYAVAELVAAGAPIDAFGVGTKLAVNQDAPYMDMVYKLVEYDGRMRTKLSSGKVLYPGRKQFFRTTKNGRLTGDVIGRFDEDLPGEPQLQPVMRGGRRLAQGNAGLETARRHAADELTRLGRPWTLPETSDDPYPVRVSPALESDLEKMKESQLEETAR